MAESEYDFPFDCEKSCVCDGDLSLCPNVAAFGAAVLKHVRDIIPDKLPQQEPTQGYPLEDLG